MYDGPTKVKGPTIADLNRMEKEHTKMREGIKNLITELNNRKFHFRTVRKLRELLL